MTRTITHKYLRNLFYDEHKKRYVAKSVDLLAGKEVSLPTFDFTTGHISVTGGGN